MTIVNYTYRDLATGNLVNTTSYAEVNAVGHRYVRTFYTETEFLHKKDEDKYKAECAEHAEKVREKFAKH